MKILFMGTPEFAAHSLKALVLAGHEITCVVTQPDKPKGRGKEMAVSAVKECALGFGLPVFQPVKIKTPEAVEEIKKYEADIFVVAAFGQILSQEILDMPRLGCINVHASLLPKYRGAAPIQRAIIEGEEESGVTIMQMEAGLDTGDMIAKKAIPITAEETGDSLHDKLSLVGAELLIETLPKIETGEVCPKKQEDEKATYAKMLYKAMGEIDWTQQSEQIERLIRGLNSWPSAYTYFRGKILKIWEAKTAAEASTKEAGTILAAEKEYFSVKTGDGALHITQVQLEGKKRMSAKDFMQGYKFKEHETLQL